MTLSHVGYSGPECAAGARHHPTARRDKRHVGTARGRLGVRCRAEQCPALSRRNNAGGVHGFTAAGLNRVQLYLHSIKVLDEAFKPL